MKLTVKLCWGKIIVHPIDPPTLKIKTVYLQSMFVTLTAENVGSTLMSQDRRILRQVTSKLTSRVLVLFIQSVQLLFLLWSPFGLFLCPLPADVHKHVTNKWTILPRMQTLLTAQHSSVSILGASWERPKENNSNLMPEDPVVLYHRKPKTDTLNQQHNHVTWLYTADYEAC